MVNGSRLWSAVGVVSLLLAAGPGKSLAAAGNFDAATFFKGKTVDVVVKSTAGSGVDLVTRLIVGRLSDLVPGNPRFQVSNLDDLGGVSQVYEAPASRLVMGSTTQSSYLYASMLDKAARHDIFKMRIVAGQGAEPSVSVIFNEPAKAYNNFREASGKKGPLFKYVETVGDESALVGSPFMASWLCDIFNLACTMRNVARAGSTALIPAVERGEVDWIESNAANSARIYAKRFENRTAKVFAEHSDTPYTAKVTTPHARPNLVDQLPASARAEYETVVALGDASGVGLTFFTGPNFPAEAVKAVGDAYMRLMKDPEFVNKVAQSRVGANSNIPYVPVAIAPEDAQRIIFQQAKIFFANQEFAKKKQKEYYAKYWKN